MARARPPRSRYSRDSDREQATVLLTTHDLAEAEKLADRVLFAQFGKSVADLEARRASLEDTYMALVQEYEQ